ncbi:MAG: hypothetical protein DHS20C14_01280 [Phycisphaeraceae bacterium]|nr:MAG: hypothetical protein DHS20C14_01280 [Phycisphaeraceae bacterium]
MHSIRSAACLAVPFVFVSVSGAAPAQVPVRIDALRAAAGQGEGLDAGPRAPIMLELPDGRVARLMSGRVSETRAGRVGDGASEPGTIFTLTGRVADGGTYVLARTDDAVWGAVWTADGAFEIHGTGSADARGRPLAEVVPVARNLPACMAGAEEHLLEGVDGAPVARGAETVARVLVAIGPSVASQLGSDANRAVFAASAVASANEALGNSDLGPFELELAGYTVVDSLPSDNGGTLLHYSTGVHEGHMDELHVLRDAYQADLVPLVVDVSGFCGVAWLAPDDASYSGFSVIDLDCAIGNLTFAHELGHNYGCAHDPDNAGGSYFPYGYGHRWNGEQYRSVMSYSPGQRVPYFSNPDVSAFGGATGIANQRDNARLIEQTDDLITSFRMGATDPADCDGSGAPDAIEIAAGDVRDDNANGVPDSCDIAAGAPDCNANGILDDYEARPNVFETSLPIGPVGDGQTASATMAGLPEADGNVSMDIVIYGDLGESSELLTVTLDNGEWSNIYGAGYPFDCYAPTVLETVTLSAAQFNALRDGPGVEIEVEGTPDVGLTVCSASTAATVRFRYRAFNDAVDADRDGVLDVCAVACPADVDGNGVLNVDDVDAFVAAFIGGDLAVDFDGNGTLNVDDVDGFVSAFIAGCP